MITIITGRKGSGKTSLLEQLYHEENAGVGVLTQKVYQGDEWIGYDLVRLPDKSSAPFIRFKAYQHTLGPVHLLHYNRFVFSQKAFQEASQWLIDAIHAGHTPIWIDEIGNQELQGEGFDEVVKQALAAGAEMRFVFRLHRFNDLLQHYHITHYKQIKCK